jgi:Spy/CpxP family protein refolding chaperone
MLTRSLALLTTLALVGLAGCGRIDPNDPKDRARISQRAADHLDDALDEVDATDAQRQALAGLEGPVLTEAFRFFEGQPAAKATLWGQWGSAAADPATVHAVVDERVESLRKIMHAAADAALKAHATLTPEQRAELAAELGHRAD